MAAEALHVELLHACRLNCLACDHRLLGGKRLSAAGLRRVFAAPGFSRARLVSFSGGEPLLHPELARIVTDAAAAFPRASLVVLTSLFETAALKKFLGALPRPLTARLHLGSSLDGPPAVHDRMRGKAGAFAALKRSHAWLKNNFPLLSTGFTFTAASVNAACFYRAWRAARWLGAPLGLQFLAPNANTPGLGLKDRDKAALAAGLRAALAEIAAAGAPAAPEAGNLKAALGFLEGISAAVPCGAGKTFFMLSPDGRFYLCPFHKELTAGLPGISKLRGRLKGRAAAACAGCFLRCSR
jgi:MoaA/NifB/PqqE/SkfB family radical SAM enzyme